MKCYDFMFVDGYDYKNVVSIYDVKTKPTKEELEYLYSVKRVPIKIISKLFGWSNCNVVSGLVTEYGFYKWHLDTEFKPNHEEFLNLFKDNSILKLSKIYNQPRAKITKYINEHNLDIGYFKNTFTNDELVLMLENDFYFNVAKKLNIATTEMSRRLKKDNIVLNDIDVKFDILSKLKEFVSKNDKYEPKTITCDSRLISYIDNSIDGHFLSTDKLTEKVYRLVNEYSPDYKDVCMFCKVPLKFYTTILGYGNSEINLCKKCIPNWCGFGVSKVSQQLFESIFNQCDFLNTENTKYSNLNGEYNVDISKAEITEKTNKLFYSIDFIHNKKIIEFDGTYWHKDDEYESAKDKFLKSKGYEILHITDKEYYKDKTAIINKCIEYLKS